jgi:hypothetical protein
MKKELLIACLSTSMLAFSFYSKAQPVKVFQENFIFNASNGNEEFDFSVSTRNSTILSRLILRKNQSLSLCIQDHDGNEYPLSKSFPMHLLSTTNVHPEKLLIGYTVKNGELLLEPVDRSKNLRVVDLLKTFLRTNPLDSVQINLNYQSQLAIAYALDESKHLSTDNPKSIVYSVSQKILKRDLEQLNTIPSFGKFARLINIPIHHGESHCLVVADIDPKNLCLQVFIIQMNHKVIDYLESKALERADWSTYRLSCSQ